MWWNHLRRRDERGVSLVELLVGLLVLSLVAAGAAAGYRAMARVAPSATKAAEGAEALTALQRVGEELQSAVAVTEATPTSVTVVASTSSSAVAWRYTDPATGGQGVLRRYAVRYYFQDGTLYRAVGAPPQWRNIPDPVGNLPASPDAGQPPTPPSVPHPGQRPDCPDPCYDPSGAYWARWAVTLASGQYGTCPDGCVLWSGGTVYVPIVDRNSATPLTRDHYRSYQTVVYRECGFGEFTWNCLSYSLQTSPLSEWPYPVLLTGRLAGLYDGNVVSVPGVYSYCGEFGEYTCRYTTTMAVVVLAPFTSAVREAWVPSCNCYMDEQTFNRNLANWNSRSGDMTAWQDRYNQWSTYYRSYGVWARRVVAVGETTQGLVAVATEGATGTPDYFQPSDPPQVDLSTSRPVARYTRFSFTYYDASGNPTSSPADVRKIVARGVVGAQAATALAQLGLPGFNASASRPRRVPPPCQMDPSLCPPPPPEWDPTYGDYQGAVQGGGDGPRTVAVEYRDTMGNTVYGSVTYNTDGTVTVQVGRDAYEQALAGLGQPNTGWATFDSTVNMGAWVSFNEDGTMGSGTYSGPDNPGSGDQNDSQPSDSDPPSDWPW